MCKENGFTDLVVNNDTVQLAVHSVVSITSVLRNWVLATKQDFYWENSYNSVI